MTSAPELFRNRAKARVGTTVRDKWRLEALLGIGGTAAVYAATHRNGNRVAIKILRSELASYEEVTTRFAREGYVANKIGHPGVVSVLDDDVTDDGAPFLVMELLEGHSLDRYTKGASSPLPLERVLPMIDQVLDVLAVAHAQNVIHRDIKPANIFLGRGDEVKVLDFGIARMTDALDAAMTQTGTAIGTPGYMAPEQARGRWSEVDARTDLWAVGATMYALLIGQRPRRADTMQEELLAAMTVPMQPLATVLAGVPPAVAAFVDRSVAFDRTLRYDDARAMQAALRSIAGFGAVTLVRPPPPSLRAQPTDASNDVTTAASIAAPAVDFVDELTVASGPSYQVPPEELSGATAHPFTLPSQPVAIPVPNPPARSRGAWLFAAMVVLAGALGLVLLWKRPATSPLPLAEPPTRAAATPSAAGPSEPEVRPTPPEPLEAAVAPTPPSAVAAPGKKPPKKVGPVKPPSVQPDRPKEDPRCKNPETAPPSCFR